MTFPHNNEARNEIIKVYSTNELTEIANNGCVTGVATHHIYYKDTISFFDKYEAEILSEITDILGVDTLVSIFKEHDACYDAYRNDCTWTFIELVAMDVVNELEQIAEDEEKQIIEYMKPIDGINPAQSMNLDRYSQV